MPFCQLINTKTNQVIAQREGGDVEYCTNHVWRLMPDHAVIEVEHSDHIHPLKFFKAMQNDLTVKIYRDVIDDKEPSNLQAAWTGKAQDIESALMKFNADEWSAFDESGKWLGTSES